MQPNLLLYENKPLFHTSQRKIHPCVNELEVGFSASPGEDCFCGVFLTGCFLFCFPSISGQVKFCFKLPITKDFCKVWTLPSSDAAARKLAEQLLPPLPRCCPAAKGTVSSALLQRPARSA